MYINPGGRIIGAMLLIAVMASLMGFAVLGVSVEADSTYEPPTSGIKYDFKSDESGIYAIIVEHVDNKKLNPAGGKLIIPDHVLYGDEWVPVKVIGEKAFGTDAGGSDYNKNIKEVVIPNTVERIEKHAFGRTCLKSIEIPENVKFIGKNCFINCVYLKDVVIKANIEKPVVDEDNSLWFKGCKELETATIYGGVGALGRSTFGECKALKSVVIMDGVTKLGEYVFNGCENLEEIIFPNTLNSVPGNIFFNGSQPTSEPMKFEFYTGGVKLEITAENLQNKCFFNRDEDKKFYSDVEVVFMNGAAKIESKTLPYGKSFGTLPDKKDGYKFDAWYSDSSFAEETKISGDSLVPFVHKSSELKYYAKSSPCVLIVNYDGNGATEGNAWSQYLVYDPDAELKLLPNGNYFQKNDMTFIGWEDKDSTEKYDDGHDVKELLKNGVDTLNLRCVWTDKYTITSDIENGGIDTDSATKDEEVIIGIVCDEHYTLPPSVTVNMNGSELDPSKYKYENGKITIYKVEGNIIVSGKCVPETFAVTGTIDKGEIDKDAGAYHESLEIKISIDDPEHYTLPSLSDIKVLMKGSPFTDFQYDQDTGSIAIEKDRVEGDIVVLGKCKPKVYTFTIEMDEGISDIRYRVDNTSSYSSYTGPFDIEYGYMLTLELYLKSGYAFVEWSDGNNEMQRVYGLVGSNIKLSATSKNLGSDSHQITFNGNGGSPAETILSTDESGVISTFPDVKRDGFNLSGWFLGDGTTQIYPGHVFDSNTTVYAHWVEMPDPDPKPKPKPQVITVDVTFEHSAGGRTSSDSETVPLNSKVTINGDTLIIGSGSGAKTVKAIADEGFAFDSWSIDEMNLREDMTITATFKKVSLEGISVKDSPYKVNYNEGEKFDPAGLTILLKYSDGSASVVKYDGNESKFSFSPSLDTPLKTDDTKVILTYGGKSTSVQITVSGSEDNMMLYIILGLIALIVLIAIAAYLLRRQPAH